MYTLQAAAQACPSIMADYPEPGVSDKYSFFPTHRALTAALEAGWEIHGIKQQAHDKRPEARHYAAHAVLLRHPKVKPRHDCHFQVQLINSHDRSRRLGLNAGLFRQVCSNGLTVTISGIARVRLLHLQSTLKPGAVIESLDIISKQAPLVYQNIERYGLIELSVDQQVQLAADSLAARYGKAPPTVSPQAVLKARRKEDVGADLWRVFNRVQENITMGCEDGRHRSKPISSLQEQVIVNRKLWEIMERVATLNKN